MRVVLVAANEKLKRSIAGILETRGHDVVCFTEARLALLHLETDVAANAFLVVNTERATDGIEICWDARLIASFERPIYICLISKSMRSETMIEALDCGADDVLQLPLSSDELYARLRSAERVNQMQLKLVEMATRDGLTGLMNRQAFFKRATKLCREARAPFAAIMADIDHFKSVNDQFGHAAGDKALRAVADRIGCRGEISDRLGGEEFVLLLADSNDDVAWRAAEDLRRDIALTEIELEASLLSLSCSFGVAIGAPGESIDSVLRRADKALYAAKRGGRNMVALDGPDQSALPETHRSLIRQAGDRLCCHRQIAG